MTDDKIPQWIIKRLHVIMCKVDSDEVRDAFDDLADQIDMDTFDELISIMLKLANDCYKVGIKRGKRDL